MAADILSDSKKVVIVQMIVSLAKNLKASVTVEGVETREQLEFIAMMACDEIQGYYFSKPLLPEALEEFIKNNDVENLNAS